MEEEGELRRALRGEGGLRWNDVPLSALDFHCSNVLDAVMRQGGILQSLSKIEGVKNVKNANDLQQLAQEAMWYASTGTCFKQAAAAALHLLSHPFPSLSLSHQQALFVGAEHEG